MQKLMKVLTGFFLIAVIFTCVSISALFYACSKLSDTVFIKDFFYKKYSLIFDSNEVKTEYSGLSVFVKSPYISIGDGNSATPFLDVKDFSIRVKILPLLFRKISVSEFCAKEISINLKRLNDGSVDFLKYINFNNSSFFSLDLTGANISVPKYDLNFNDDFVKNNFSINGYSLVANGANINSGHTLAANGCFTVNGEPSYYLVDVEYIKQKGGLKLKKHEILLYSLNLAFLEKYFTELGFSNFDTKLDIYSTAQGDFFKTLFYFDNVNIAFDYKGEKNTIISKTPLIN
ncbi:MAG: hypothetical protein LUE64_06455 [Candidatus Gastranaerophilales bacterium]|nr:hypothetical protein [Candidatus Gastranaerophilales bacterium]